MRNSNEIINLLAQAILNFSNIRVKLYFIHAKEIGLNVWRFSVFHLGKEGIASLRANADEEDINDAALTIIRQLNR